MSKARVLANLISDNAELADGQISVAEVVGAAPTANPTFTGSVTVDTGSATAPSVVIGQAGLGFYRSGPGDVGLAYAGNQRIKFRDVSSGSGAIEVEQFSTGGGADNYPAYSFIEDNDTGLYLHNIGEVGLTAGGTSALVASSTGIDVTGTVSADSLIVEATASGSNVSVASLQNDGSGANTKADLDFFAANTKYATVSGGYGAATAELDIKVGNTPSKVATFKQGGDISFYEDTGNTPKMVWKSADESLGIGTDSPTTALDVRGGVNSAHATFTGQVNRGLVVSTANTLSNDDGVIYNAQTAGSGKHIFQTAGTERVRIDADGNIGIGKVPPTDTHATWSQLFLGEKGSYISEKSSSGGNYGNYVTDNLYVDSDTGAFANITTDESSAYRQEGGVHHWYSQASGSAGAAVTLSEKMLIDSSGNLLVGTTNASLGTGGIQLNASGRIGAAASSLSPLVLNRKTSDGTIVDIRKDGATVGIIASVGGDRLSIGTTDVGLFFDATGDEIEPWSMTAGSVRDAAINIGRSGGRFKDLYLSGGVYLGGTGAANKFDDYEYGSWTPSFVSGQAPDGTVSSLAGEYVKVGKLVTVYCKVTGSNLNITDYVRLQGLPFSAGNKNATGTYIIGGITNRIHGWTTLSSGTNNWYWSISGSTSATSIAASVTYKI